jgi:hypothetical protein
MVSNKLPFNAIDDLAFAALLRACTIIDETVFILSRPRYRYDNKI